MQITTKQRFVITLDQDEAEEFLDDATAVQTRVRDILRGASNVQNGQTHAALRAP